MKICYLVNQYPKVSHTFIRREITGGSSASAFAAQPIGSSTKPTSRSSSARA
jgi:hypothetical protein